MKCYQFGCPPGTTFKAGSVNGEDVDAVIHADTLFSAIINAYVLLYGPDTVTDFIEEFKQQQIGISSLSYGLAAAEREVLFFPKPLLDTTETRDLTQAKQAKRIRFVSTQLLQRILADVDTEHCRSRCSLLEDTVLLGGGFAATLQELPPELANQHFVHEMTDTKVQLDRRTGGAAEGMLYYESYVELTALADRRANRYQPFLYFLATVESAYEPQLNACLRLLCDEGIGGERAQGRGQFAGVTSRDFVPPTLGKGNWHYALSLVHPASNEEFRSALRYRLTTRGGHPVQGDGTPSVPLAQQRRWVRMLQEGAIFTQPVRGALVDICPDGTTQSVYRNGINFSFTF